MAEQIQLSTNAAKVLQTWRKLPASVQSGIAKSLGRRLLMLRDEVRTNADLTMTGARSGLASRITSFSRSAGKMGLDAAIGFRRTSGFPYELSQEFGARAKPGKAIAVPVSKEAKASGGPLNMTDLSLVKVGSRALLARASGSKLDVHWVLVKRLRPRLNFRRTVTSAIPSISDAVERGAKEGWAKA
jgi:hypothetical protein